MKINSSFKQGAEMREYLKTLVRSLISDPSYLNPIDDMRDIRSILNLTLSDVLSHFGTKRRFLDWIKATREIERIHETRLKNAEKEGLLVSRELVKRGIIQPIENVHKRLLTDGSRTIARRLVTMVKAKRSTVFCEKYVENQIEKFIRVAKSEVALNLKKLGR